MHGPGWAWGSGSPTAPTAQPAPANVFLLNVPIHAYDLILTRPEKNSITLSVLAYQDMEGCVAYGTQPEAYTTQMPVQQLKKNVPAELVKVDCAEHSLLLPIPLASARYSAFTNSPECTFQTARPAGSSFTFTLTADAHLDDRTNPEVYGQTLANIRADKPDFHLDLGNLFMTDKHDSRDEAAQQYLAQRYFLGQIGCSTPIFLALGTHDGESSRYDDGTGDCLAVWSNLIRKRYFPNPMPDTFYTGNPCPSRTAVCCRILRLGMGRCVFVVLDPFGDSLGQRGSARRLGLVAGPGAYRVAQTDAGAEPGEI